MKKVCIVIGVIFAIIALLLMSRKNKESVTE